MAIQSPCSISQYVKSEYRENEKERGEKTEDICVYRNLFLFCIKIIIVIIITIIMHKKIYIKCFFMYIGIFILEIHSLMLI